MSSPKRWELSSIALIFFSIGKLLHLSTGTHKNILMWKSAKNTAQMRLLYMDGFDIEYTNLTFCHAESPVWDPDIQVLYWVDVLNRNVHSLDYNTFQHTVKHIAYGEVNVVAPVAGSTQLLIGSQSQVFLLDWNSPGEPSMQLIADLAPLQPGTILNEGKADARGRFWAGTKGPQRGDKVEIDQAALYSLQQPCFQPLVQLKPVTLSNGLVWSLNNSVLYYIDSYTNKIDAFDFDLTRGRISNRRTILDVAQWGYKDGIPDGMTIDRDGLLWIAIYLNGTVLRVDPDAQIIVRKFDLPVRRVTSLAWAGLSLEDLVVTTSRRNLPDHDIAAAPLSGSIIVLQNLGTGGVPGHKFVFNRQF